MFEKQPGLRAHQTRVWRRILDGSTSISSSLPTPAYQSTGGVVGDVDAGGPVRARPVTDIHHRVWIGTHARSMLILTISDGDPGGEGKAAGEIRGADGPGLLYLCDVPWQCRHSILHPLG